MLLKQPSIYCQIFKDEYLNLEKNVKDIWDDIKDICARHDYLCNLSENHDYCAAMITVANQDRQRIIEIKFRKSQLSGNLLASEVWTEEDF